ncbi:CoA ester lyase [Rhodoplanes sp. TEM]|uniref:CoA ester lyase n=1 Tax=Rhodoplanes tepidamans TaxID=200616 RepID=A0ABT5J8W3_RHOTP|nr:MULTISPECIES: CoA ester lyase [Rhodoplanes]MDC7786038.1 CoA ester lyase [Rhodoplanes tepidamans]MDC7983821.1 CoA ester lyase [Rhodoplanes sp. TEM]MDQ0354880.1 citrate lyase subunit beta/citryl-CoA lyase [Rhodoplanes tepidamans]
MTIRPRRSVLYMPGSNTRAMEKAKTLPIDAVILDLEDSVAPDAKAEARKLVAATVKAGGFGRREVFVRVNGVDTPWFGEDFEAVVPARPDVILVPKVSSPDTLEMISQRLLDMHADARTRIWIMVETPLAIFGIRELAACATDSETRLGGFVMGTNDLAKETRVRLVPGRAPMTGWLADCVLAAHAYGLDIVDGVYNNLSDLEGFKRECLEGRDLGFDGKTLIHPNQVEPCNEVFSPSPEEVALARKIIATFDLPENSGKGVVQMDGRMVERLHAEMAKRTVAIAEAIGMA